MGVHTTVRSWESKPCGRAGMSPSPSGGTIGAPSPRQVSQPPGTDSPGHELQQRLAFGRHPPPTAAAANRRDGAAFRRLGLKQFHSRHGPDGSGISVSDPARTVLR